ncbi:minor capsid protein [Evansella tamaricis]|uniref:Minor capsid protein n=1 Tax=Evansella tamaricis TaxID=2069301 RepID=A0ABS6JBL6_9BACI|nr:minor capsid protein [Evansella tamaricis]MBU9711064.1 minor capsid protein [Evansella tamaricis]
MAKNSVELDIKVEVDWGLLKRTLGKGFDKAQEALDSQIVKDSNYYAPEDQEDLIKSGIRNTKPGTGKIIWDVPYAARLYYNPQYNFSKDKNPNAGGLWFERAKAVQFRNWLTLAQNTFNDNFKW